MWPWGYGRCGLDTAICLFFLKLLDDQFTAASVAQALGISQTQSLLWSHVYKKFMELVGPVAAQRKLDAMRSKSFVHLDPVQKAKVCYRVHLSLH